MPAEKNNTFGYWRDPVFLVSLGTYVINRELIKPNLHQYSPFFHGHLNDSLVVPVMLPIYLLAYRLLGLRPDNALPRFWEIGLHAVVWMVFFEWFGPFVLHQGVSDPLDNWSMGLGGIISWIIWQRNWLRQLLQSPSAHSVPPLDVSETMTGLSSGHDCQKTFPGG